MIIIMAFFKIKFLQIPIQIIRNHPLLKSKLSKIEIIDEISLN